MKKKIMNIPNAIPIIYYVGIMLRISLHLVMSPFGRNILVSVVKCSMGRTLRNLPSISWNIVP